MPPHDLDAVPAAAPAPEADLLAALAGRRVAVVGYGNQGRAHALNLRDAGADVVVGARPGGRGEAAARGDDFRPQAAGEAAAGADLVVLGLPDEAAPGILEADILPRLAPGATLGFMHGFVVRYRLIDPAPGLGIVMVAPKGPGDALRERYVAGEGLAALVAVDRESASGDAESLALGWAAGIGAARARIVRTTFAAETETDLFGEQAVLCGGVLALVRTGYGRLVAAGYDPDLAYMECVQELKQVTDLMARHGLASMMDRISNTAEFGAFVAAERLESGAGLAAVMDELLAAIRDGSFARRLMDDHARGFPWFEAQRAGMRGDAIEAAGERVRAWRPRPG